jgi:hypothetical protein
MANIVGCEVISLESYYKPEQAKDFNGFGSLDISLLLKVNFFEHFDSCFFLNLLLF